MLSDRSAGQGSHNDAAANSAARGVCQRQRALLIFFAPAHYYRHYYPTVNLTVSCCPQSLSSGTVSIAWAMAQTRCHHGAETFCSTVHEKDACRAQRLQVIVTFVQARQQTCNSLAAAPAASNVTEITGDDLASSCVGCCPSRRQAHAHKRPKWQASQSRQC